MAADLVRKLAGRLRSEDNARPRLMNSVIADVTPMGATVWATSMAPRAGPTAAPKFAAAPLSAVARPVPSSDARTPCTYGVVNVVVMLETSAPAIKKGRADEQYIASATRAWVVKPAMDNQCTSESPSIPASAPAVPTKAQSAPCAIHIRPSAASELAAPLG